MAKKKVKKKYTHKDVGHFFEPTWRMNYYYFIEWPYEEVIKFIKGIFDIELNMPEIYIGGRTTEIIQGEEIVICIYLRDKKEIGLLVHECVHAANLTFGRKGYRPEMYNDEPQAYLIQSIFDNSNVLNNKRG